MVTHKCLVVASPKHQWLYLFFTYILVSLSPGLQKGMQTNITLYPTPANTYACHYESAILIYNNFIMMFAHTTKPLNYKCATLTHQQFLFLCHGLGMTVSFVAQEKTIHYIYSDHYSYHLYIKLKRIVSGP